jgi:hypothetical protein
MAEHRIHSPMEASENRRVANKAEGAAVWAKLDDEIFDHPKILAAGPLATLLHIAAIVWSCRNLTDGFIPAGKVNSLIDWHGVLRHSPVESDFDEQLCAGWRTEGDDFIQELLDLKLWHDAPRGYLIHDFDKYQRSKAQWLALRKNNTERQKRHRGRGRNAVTNGVSNGHVTLTPVPEGNGSSPDLLRSGSGSSAPDVLPAPVPEEENLSFASLTLGEWAFADFWAAYPKKRHKPDALKAWRQVGADHTPLPIRGGLERWKGSDAWQRGFIEDPATFLRQRQWEDMPATSSHAQTQTNYRNIKRGIERVHDVRRRGAQP